MTTGMGDLTGKTVVYDLDGVITTKDTLSCLLVGRLTASPLKLVRSLPIVVRWFWLLARSPRLGLPAG